MRNTAIILAAGALFALCGNYALAHDMHSGKAALEALDKDHDGSLTWPEVLHSVVYHYEGLNESDHATGFRVTILSDDKVQEILRREKHKHVNPDHDASLNISEYVSVAHYRFKKADREGDGALDETELNSREGKDMLRMMQRPGSDD